MIGLDRPNKWSETGERTFILPSLLLPLLPYWFIISPYGCLQRASINSPPQPWSSRAYPLPLLYLTCSLGSQQTVKGQKAEAREHRKYSNHCLSDGFRFVFPLQKQSRHPVLAPGIEAYLATATPHTYFTKTQPEFCFSVIKSHAWGNQWSVSCVSISFTIHTTHHRSWLLLFWRAVMRSFFITSAKKVKLSHLFSSVS